jgi:hypothetical protein
LIGPQQPGQLFAAHRLGGFERQIDKQGTQLVVSKGYRLAAAGKPVKALVRATSDPAKVEKLKSLGATVV